LKFLLVHLLTVVIGLLSTGARAAEFVAGADFSHLGFFEDRGIVYKDAGEPADALVILKRGGLNCVRLRLFTSSTEQARADAYNYTNNLEYTLPLATRVKRAGLQLMLDFHYSDSWADPGKQNKPAAWAGLNFAGPRTADVRL
jgi:arabinogalactan endo-1,4-beta-galactosidase